MTKNTLPEIKATAIPADAFQSSIALNVFSFHGVTVALVHTLTNGEVRLRVGRIDKVAVSRAGKLYIVIEDGEKGMRTVIVSSITDFRVLSV